jgi:rhamnogalacturonan endolyase
MRSALVVMMALCGSAQAADCSTWGRPGAVLFQDDFDGPLTGYVAEYARKPGNVVENRDGRLVLDVDGGATVWLDRPLYGNVVVSFTRRVIVDGGRNDRLSDLNMFWMARDPKRADLFTRSGKFEDYDDLAMYYAGIGGNRNTTTRLRRYGGGRRELLADYTDGAHLLEANRDYRIEIAVYEGCTRVRVDGNTWFTYRDPHPLTSGWFGLRTTWSRQTVDDLKIQRLD